MSVRDTREIGVWALVTALLVVGTLAPRPVDSAGPSPAAAQPTATIDGCTVSASAAASAQPYHIDVTLQATNSSPEVRNCRVTLALVRQEFGGLAMSRVAGASDYRRTLERSVEVDLGSVGSSPVTKTIALAIDARPAAGAAANAVVLGAVPAQPAAVRTVMAPTDTNTASATVVRSLLASAGVGWAVDGTAAVGRVQAPETQRAVFLTAAMGSQNAQMAAQAPRTLTPVRGTRAGGVPVYQVEVTPPGARAPVVLASFSASTVWPKP